MFEASVAAAADTIVVDTETAPLLRSAIDVLADDPERKPSEQLLVLRRALGP
jgi:hypothetical protein